MQDYVDIDESGRSLVEFSLSLVGGRTGVNEFTCSFETLNIQWKSLTTQVTLASDESLGRLSQLHIREEQGTRT